MEKITIAKKQINGKIAYAQLMKMHEHYHSHHGACLDKCAGHPETRSVWFENNADFKELLRQLQDPANNVSGLRIYFCQYNDGTEVPAGYEQRLTVGFVATKYNTSSQKQEDDKGDQPLIIMPVDPYNTGKICPPDICP